MSATAENAHAAPSSRASLDWRRDGANWPLAQYSRFVSAGGLSWHIQQYGNVAGPQLVLIHGTGASTHTWAGLGPLLGQDYHITAMDLPGHGFSAPADASAVSLEGFAERVGTLLNTLGIRPDVAIGHSAGAAVLVRMQLDDRLKAQDIISLNGALLPFAGVAGHIFPVVARMMSLNPLIPRLFAWRAKTSDAVARLMSETGSRLSPDGLDRYAQLFESPQHVRATLSMMANWNLERLEHDLPSLKTRLVLMAGTNDRTVPPSTSRSVARHVVSAKVDVVTRLGHLMHEEAPETIARRIAVILKK